MKISIIGAGNVGGLTAMRLAQEGVEEVALIDVAKGLAQGKALDMEDASSPLKRSYKIKGSEDIKEIKDSDLVINTAGLPRKPGMTREELRDKNAGIIKEIAGQVKKLATDAIFIIVTNPLDLMCRLALDATGFKPNKVIGMGPTLDSARFANLVSKELNVPHADIEACVIGSHGEGMLPLPRFTKIKGVALEEFLSKEKIQELTRKTVLRGAEIVNLLGSGSAYFAPSAAIAELVRAVAKDEKRILGVCAYLNKEYGLKDVSIGIPCRIGKEGIEQIIELELNQEEKAALSKTASSLKEQYQGIKNSF